MSVTRYYEETPCEHGQLEPHLSPEFPLEIECPGGQRRELTGVKVVEANTWHTVLYTAVGICYLAIGVLLTIRLIGRPITPTPFITAILLSIVFVVPAAIQLAAHLAARRLISEQRNGE